MAQTQAAERRLSRWRLVTTVTAGTKRESEEETEVPVQLLLGLKRGTSALIGRRSVEEKVLSIHDVSHIVTCAEESVFYVQSKTVLVETGWEFRCHLNDLLS